MPTQLGTVLQHYGGVLPNHFQVTTGTNDLIALTPESGVQFAVYVIHLSNEGAAFKQFILRNGGGSSSPVIGRIGAVNDVSGTTLYFNKPLILVGLFLDQLAGTDSCSVSVISHRIVEGL